MLNPARSALPQLLNLTAAAAFAALVAVGGLSATGHTAAPRSERPWIVLRSPAPARDRRALPGRIDRRAVLATRPASIHRRTPSGPTRQPLSGRQSGPTFPAVIRVVEVTSAANGQAAVDRCMGPVEVLYTPFGYPNDIVEHDYCGGAWFLSLTPGTRIRVVGGTQPGLYVVNGRRRVVPWGSTIAAMHGLGALVLQTCQGHSMVFIGLSRT